MRVSQAVFGVYHHFALAHQLRGYDALGTVYSTYPWRRLRREGIPQAQVATFPWVHGPLMALARYGLYPSRWTKGLDYANALLFDQWLTPRINQEACDALIAISGAGLRAGASLQERGGKYICDRGSSHARYQWRLVSAEHRRWQVPFGTYDERDTVREEQQYAQADCIVVPSTFAARSFMAEGIPAEKLRTIPYGVELDAFHPQGAPDPERFDVAFAGQVNLRKGIPYLLEAFARVRHPRKRLRLLGPVLSYMKPVLARLPMENVEVLGPVGRADMIRYLSASHVLVLPSIEEGFGLVQGEAMACGCPVIASSNTGAADLFTDGVEGFIVPPGDADALAERLQELADDPAKQESIRQAALDRVRHLGGWNDYGDRWIAVLRGLIGEDIADGEEPGK